MRFIHMAVLFSLVAAPAGAAHKSVRYFYDGAVVEYEVAAHKGNAELVLPSDVQPNSLRVKPLAGAVIAGVSTSAVEPVKPARELGRLEERRSRLLARLKAVEAREEIFLAAAKSQSAKAPRKTKANPDPLGSIRQGTELALRNLEETYRVKLQTEAELRDVEATVKSVKEKEAASDTVVRVRVKPAGARVMISYVLPRQSWKPAYEFHASGNGTVAIIERALLPMREKSVVHRVVPATLASWDGSIGPVLSDDDQTVARYSFSTGHERLESGGLRTFAFSFRNEGSFPLPPGEASCYRNGEYFGTFTFGGVRAGEASEVSCGK